MILTVTDNDGAYDTTSKMITVRKSKPSMWAKYVKTGVHEDYLTYIPTPADFGEYAGLVEDNSTLMPYHIGDAWTIVGFRTWIYVSEHQNIGIGINGDDCVGLYCDGELICGSTLREPMNYGTMELSTGWHKIEALVYNAITDNYLEFDKTLSNHVDAMTIANLSAWQYNHTIYIKENSDYYLTDYQILINLSGNNFPVEANESGADIRFVDEYGNMLNYWIEEWNYPYNTLIWIKVPYIPANGIITLQMYWGNPGATPMSYGDAVFEFFDGFSGRSLDGTKWIEDHGDGTLTVLNSTLTLDTGGTGNAERIYHDIGKSSVMNIESKIRWITSYDKSGDMLAASKNSPFTCVADGGGCGGGVIAEREGYFMYWSWTKAKEVGNVVSSNTDYHRFKIVADGTKRRAYVDDSFIELSNEGRARYITFGAACADSGHGIKLESDWIFVRKYAAFEPTVSLDKISVDTSPSVSWSYSEEKIEQTGLGVAFTPSQWHDGAPPFTWYSQRLGKEFSTLNRYHMWFKANLFLPESVRGQSIILKGTDTPNGEIQINDDLFVYVNGKKVAQEGTSFSGLRDYEIGKMTGGWYADPIDLSNASWTYGCTNVIEILVEDHCRGGAIGGLTFEVGDCETKPADNISWSYSEEKIEQTSLGIAFTPSQWHDGAPPFAWSSQRLGTNITALNRYHMWYKANLFLPESVRGQSIILKGTDTPNGEIQINDNLFVYVNGKKVAQEGTSFSGLMDYEIGKMTGGWYTNPIDLSNASWAYGSINVIEILVEDRLDWGAVGGLTFEQVPQPNLYGAPEITSWYPVGTEIYDSEGATRTFNVTANQTVNVSWLINGTEVQKNTSVTSASYTNTSAVEGTWNVSAIVTNVNGTDMQVWVWNVTLRENQPPVANFTYSPANPIVAQTITFNASNSTDPDGNITKCEWNFGDENITNTTEPIINHTYASAGTFTVNLTVTDNEGATNAPSRAITVSEGLVFDTGTGTYPSIAGTHNGTITPNVTIEVSKLYTYPCAGTGGHPEHVMIKNESGVIITEADWNGYQEEGYNISFDNPFTLVANETYNYTIRTGSYPQIIHATSRDVACGTITCDTFVDANGNTYTDWIPAIRLGE